jgi:hypothetical protein
MKKIACLTLGLAGWLTGCGEQCCPPETHSATNAPAGYLQNAAASQQQAVKTVDLTALNKAIQLFQVQEGRLPKDLDELVAQKYIPEIPLPPVGMKLSYNVTQGTVSLEKL